MVKCEAFKSYSGQISGLVVADWAICLQVNTVYQKLHINFLNCNETSSQTCTTIKLHWSAEIGDDHIYQSYWSQKKGAATNISNRFLGLTDCVRHLYRVRLSITLLCSFKVHIRYDFNDVQKSVVIGVFLPFSCEEEGIFCLGY